jgi:uncharacterized protein YqiB (DUF1249 family)
MVSFSPVEKSLWLQKVCEGNFVRLMRLAPDLPSLGVVAKAKVIGKPELYLRLIERSPFTLILELTHDFSGAYASLMEPAVRLRVCLDSRTVEMLSDFARAHVYEVFRHTATPECVLDYKWNLNYFLSRWLDHCLECDYHFVRGVEKEFAMDLVSA